MTRFFGMLAVALLASPAAMAAQGMDVSLPLGAAAPDVALVDLEGSPVQLASLIDGRPALIEFWATWCENCEALQPQLDEIHERFSERIQVVAIAVAVAQSERRVRRHVEDHGAGYPYLWDGEGAAVRAYKAATTSIVVLVDEEGKIAYTGVGGDQELVAAVEALLGT